MRSNPIFTADIISDLHLTNSNRHYRVASDGQSDLLSRQKAFLDYIAQSDAHAILDLGDATDEEIVNPYVLSALNDLLLGSIAKTGKLVIHLEGNHCIVDGENVYSILASYKNRISDNVRLTVDQPSDMVIEVEGKKIYIRSVPYIGDYEKMRQMIVKPLDELYVDFALLLYHAPTVNAMMDNGLPATKGLHLQSEDLDQYNLAIAGDFHRPQSFMVGETPVYYCGAPFALTRGQNFDLQYRRLEVFEDGSFELSSIPNPFSISIKDVEYDKLNIDDYDPASTVLYVNNTPHSERKRVNNLLKDAGFYSYKIKVAPIVKSTVLEEGQKERLSHHKKQDIKQLFESVLSINEKSDLWIQSLIETISK